MATDKPKFALRMSPETEELVKNLYKQDNCKSRTEFIEKAIHFYAGYLASQDATEFLSRVLLNMMKGIVQDSEYRVRQNLFKLATEVGLNTRVISTYEGIDDIRLSRIRGAVVADLKRTNGQLRLEDAVRDKGWIDKVNSGAE